MHQLEPEETGEFDVDVDGEYVSGFELGFRIGDVWTTFGIVVIGVVISL